MEKEVTKEFYLYSAVNIIPAVWLGGGLTLNSLLLVMALGVFVVNHLVLVRLVNTLTAYDTPNQSSRILFLLFAKMALIGGCIGLIYFFKQDLIVKVMAIMIFQLIIQVLSIRNN